MADYAIVNLKDLENTAARFSDGVEGRFGRMALGSEHLGVSYWRYGPGVRSSFGHAHREQEEAYVVTSGSGRILLDGEACALEPWDAIRVAPQVVRAFEAGDDGLELIAIGADRPEGGDGVRSEVTWPD